MSKRGRMDTKEVAVITGGTSGIGESCVKRFVADGYQVVFSGRNLEAGSRVAAETKAEFIKCDVTSETEVKDFFQQVKAKYGRLDALVHSAGYAGTPIARTGQIPFDTYREVMSINADGSFLILKYGVELMVELKNGGRVVNVSSEVSLVAGVSSDLMFPHYGVSKYALNGLTQIMAMEYVQHDIRINAVCPGPINTNLIAEMISSAPDPDAMAKHIGTFNLMTAKANKGLPRPEDVAGVCSFLCGPDSKFINGSLLPIDGGYHCS